MTGRCDVQRVIDKCKDNGRLLLVLVYDDETCDEVTAVWNSDEVTSLINGYKKCELLQLSYGSLECTNFSHLYPLLVTPSVFIINHDGIPLDMLFGRNSITIKELSTKIHKAIEAHKSGKSRLVVTRQPLPQKHPVRNVRAAAPAILNQRRASPRDKVNHVRLQQGTPATAATSGGVAHRRTTQQSVVKEQTTTKSVSSSEVCRLQLKMAAGGDRIVQQFHPSDMLSVVKECASKGFGIPSDSVMLEKSYPAYKYTVDDETKSLSELQLVPTAILIVRQKATESFLSVALFRAIEFFVFVLSLVVWPLKQLRNFVTGSSGSQMSSRQSTSQRTNSWQTVKRRGNVTSFRQGDNEDDDQNTYNGNSTQQQ